MKPEEVKEEIEVSNKAKIMKSASFVFTGAVLPSAGTRENIQERVSDIKSLLGAYGDLFKKRKPSSDGRKETANTYIGSGFITIRLIIALMIGQLVWWFQVGPEANFAMSVIYLIELMTTLNVYKHMMAAKLHKDGVDTNVSNSYVIMEIFKDPHKLLFKNYK